MSLLERCSQCRLLYPAATREEHARYCGQGVSRWLSKTRLKQTGVALLIVFAILAARYVTRHAGL